MLIQVAFILFVYKYLQMREIVLAFASCNQNPICGEDAEIIFI